MEWTRGAAPAAAATRHQQLAVSVTGSASDKDAVLAWLSAMHCFRRPVRMSRPRDSVKHTGPRPPPSPPDRCPSGVWSIVAAD